jgi:hypothetical protein
MKYVWIISCLLFVCSCNTVREDFAEIISLKLTYGPKDLLQALDRAKTPYNA